MGYTKRIVCLANSRKFSGTCVAGLELVRGKPGGWIRPVSARSSEELSLDERRYGDGKDVRVLDIVDIRLKEARPHAPQTENHVIDARYHWARVGEYDPVGLRTHAVNSGKLWINGFSSYSGRNDRIPIDQADKQTSSLMLVAPSKPVAVVGSGLKKRQVRLEFELDAAQYRFVVTDSTFEAEYMVRKEGEYTIKGPILVCVSLGEPFEGYRYKLAAAIIKSPR